MMYILAGCLAAQIAFSVYLLRAAARDRAALLAVVSRASSVPSGDLKAMIDLVDRLCQRVQAPTQAVVDHSLSTVTPPSAESVPVEDDEAYWAAQNVPKEQLAEMAYNLELAG